METFLQRKAFAIIKMHIHFLLDRWPPGQVPRKPQSIHHSMPYKSIFNFALTRLGISRNVKSSMEESSVSVLARPSEVWAFSSISGPLLLRYFVNELG
jgi:hypothetical protein